MTATTARRSVAPVTATSSLFAEIVDASALVRREELAQLAELATKGHARPTELAGREVVTMANLTLALVSFDYPDSDRVQEIVRTLAAISELDVDSEVVLSHEVTSFVVKVARAAFRGHTLPFAGEVSAVARRLVVDRTVRVAVDAGASDPTVIGAIYVAAHSERDDRGTPWASTYDVPEQIVAVRLVTDRSGSADNRVCYTLGAIERTRETGAQLGGVDVVRETLEVDAPTTRSRSARDYEFARFAITERPGRELGETLFVLHPEARVTVEGYAHDPAALCFRIAR